MRNSRTAVLFDLDGTLLDTLTDLAASGNEVLSSRGLPTHPVEAYKTFIGEGMLELVRRIFPDEHRPAEGAPLAAALEEYRSAYSSNWTNTTCLFPGIADLLDELKRSEIPIGVFSNKAHDFTVKCVEEFLTEWEWDIVLGHREGKAKKPEPAGAIEAAHAMNVAPANCFFVGDSDVDMQTAVNAGMRPIGVSWGFRSAEELRGAGAEVVITCPRELFDPILQLSL